MARNQTTADSDICLLRRIARGDRGALAELYDRHAGGLLRLCARILGDAAEAEDLVHDVFIELWQRAEAFNPTLSSPRTYMTLLARSRALDRRRWAAIRRQHAAMEAQAPVPVVEYATAGPLQARVSALPEAQRDVVWMMYFEGLSAPEIATRLALPLGTVKSRISYAIERLREQTKITER